MDWNKQNASGIAWNNICETIRNMYSIYWSAEKDERKNIEKVIKEVVEKMQKMNGALDS